MADFLQVKMQKILFLDYIAQYATPNSAEKAVKLKCQKIRKNFLTSKNAFKDVNWNLLLIQAKARQKALKRSTALLTAATDEAANTLENLFDVCSTLHRTQVTLRDEENAGPATRLIDCKFLVKVYFFYLFINNEAIVTEEAPLNKSGRAKKLQVPIGIESVNQYKKALMALHEYQVATR